MFNQLALTMIATLSNSKGEQKQLNFHMMVWLCAYYEFFNVKVINS